jgi:glycerol-3-phosphate dehydrogenase
MRNDVAVIGGGVVGSAIALALARRGLHVVMLEAEAELGLGASGTNSGILHSGFDSIPGELETKMILRSTPGRDAVIEALGLPVLRCGAVMADAPGTYPRNRVRARRSPDGALEIPGEWVTDPVAWTLGLAAAAQALGAQVRTGFRVVEIDPGLVVTSADDAVVEAGAVVNAAGLHADDVAAAAGEVGSFAIFPRKGEFLVFEGAIERIRLPTPTKRTKGVLAFPTVDGHTIVGPTAVDGSDKADWSVRASAREELLAAAVRMAPELEGRSPVFAYAGLRPAGASGANYVIGESKVLPGLMHAAAIRSTGLSASLGIGEHVAELLAPGHAVAPLPNVDPPAPDREPWWRRTARVRGA